MLGALLVTVTGEDDGADPTGATPHAGRRTWLRRAVVAALGSAVLLAVALIGTNLIAGASARGHRSSELSDVPPREVALVFGAGVRGDQPTPALRDRVEAAVELHRAGTVSHLLMSGDHGRAGYDEVTVMRDLAIELGVPPEDISRDHAGFDTYDSCYRAAAIFGVHGVVLVTQDYHLTRALYTCRGLGLDAVGLGLPDWQQRPDLLDYRWDRRDQVLNQLREWAATAAAVVDVDVRHPEPRFLGPYEGLTPT